MSFDYDVLTTYQVYIAQWTVLIENDSMNEGKGNWPYNK